MDTHVGFARNLERMDSGAGFSHRRGRRERGGAQSEREPEPSPITRVRVTPMRRQDACLEDACLRHCGFSASLSQAKTETPERNAFERLCEEESLTSARI